MLSEIEGDDRLWTRNAAPVERSFQKYMMFLQKIMLIYDVPLLSGESLLSVDLPIPREWPLNGGLIVL